MGKDKNNKSTVKSAKEKTSKDRKLTKRKSEKVANEVAESKQKKGKLTAVKNSAQECTSIEVATENKEGNVEDVLEITVEGQRTEFASEIESESDEGTEEINLLQSNRNANAAATFCDSRANTERGSFVNENQADLDEVVSFRRVYTSAEGSNVAAAQNDNNGPIDPEEEAFFKRLQSFMMKQGWSSSKSEDSTAASAPPKAQGDKEGSKGAMQKHKKTSNKAGKVAQCRIKFVTGTAG